MWTILDQSAYTPDRSVAVQQIFSTLYQHRGNGMREQALVPVLQELLSPQEVAELLSHLVLRGSLERRGAHLFLSTTVLDEAERGQIHSNIPDATTYRVIDAESNREVGTIAGMFEQVFLLGSSVWQVLTVKYPIIRAKRYRGPADPAVFKRHPQAGKYEHLLPPARRRQG